MWPSWRCLHMKTWRGWALGRTSSLQATRASSRPAKPAPALQLHHFGSSPPPVLSGREREKKTLYLKLNTLSSKLFVASRLGSRAKHEWQCAEMAFPKDNRTVNFVDTGSAPKTSTVPLSDKKLAELTGPSGKGHPHVTVTQGKQWHQPAAPQLLCASQVQLSPGDLHQLKVWHLLIDSASAARGHHPQGGCRSDALYATGLLGPVLHRCWQAPLHLMEMCPLPPSECLTILAFLSFPLLKPQPSRMWQHLLNFKDANGFLDF